MLPLAAATNCVIHTLPTLYIRIYARVWNIYIYNVNELHANNKTETRYFRLVYISCPSVSISGILNFFEFHEFKIKSKWFCSIFVGIVTDRGKDNKKKSIWFKKTVNQRRKFFSSRNAKCWKERDQNRSYFSLVRSFCIIQSLESPDSVSREYVDRYWWLVQFVPRESARGIASFVGDGVRELERWRMLVKRSQF